MAKLDTNLGKANAKMHTEVAKNVVGNAVIGKTPVVARPNLKVSNKKK